MTTEITNASTTLETLTAKIKVKLIENKVATNIFNRTINQNSIEIGQWLTQAKNLVKHGQWQNWLTDNFNMTDRTARNYMKLAAYFGENSALKTEDVFRFQPYALLELTKLPVDKVQEFLEVQADKNLSTLSVRELREAIQQWKNPEVSTTSKEITAADIRQYFKAKFPAVNSTLPATKLLKEIANWKLTRQAQEVLRLPPPSFNQLPFELIDAAESAQLKIEMQFGRALNFPLDDGVVVTRQNSAAMKKFAAVADCVIFAAPVNFIRSDGIAKKINPAIWFFGGLIDNFLQHFLTFGAAFCPAKIR